MSDVEISYKGNTITSLNDSGTKVLTTAGKYCEGDITVGYTKPAGGDPYDIMLKYSNNTLEFFKTNEIMTSGPNFNSKSNLKYFSAKNLTGGTPNGMFYGCRAVVYVNFGLVSNFHYLTMNNGPTRGMVIVINSSSVPTTSSAVSGFNTNSLIFVRDSLVQTFKNDTNWTAVANQIFGYGDEIIRIPYDPTGSYSIGNWVIYNNKFYCYCYEGLTTITGHAPTGTTEDNEYWEYINDLGA